MIIQLFKTFYPYSHSWTNEDTINEKSLVPSCLVIGIIPRFPILNTDLQKQRELMDSVKKAQAEMRVIFAQRRALATLTRNKTPCADPQYKFGKEVWVYSEEEEKWLGTFIVVDGTDCEGTVRSLHGFQRQIFSSFQMKPYYSHIQKNLKILAKEMKIIPYILYS